MDDLIRQVSDSLERIFRHVLPGGCVLLAAWASHPAWFKNVGFNEPWQWVLLIFIGVIAGNVWYVLHRFFVHQVIDVAMYKIARQNNNGYHASLTNHIAASFKLQEHRPGLTKQIGVRSGQIIFMLIACEVAIAFTFNAECNSPLAKNCFWVWLIAIGGICAALWQYYIAYMVDKELVANPGRPQSASTAEIPK